MLNKPISRTEGLGLWLRHVHSQWRSVVDQTVQPLGLTQSRWTVLIALRHLGDGSTQKLLAETLEIELPSLSRTLDQLAQQGLVERRTCAADRRAREVFFTPWGREVLAALETRAGEARERLLAGVSENDFDAFERVLATIEENAASELGET
ncbi:MarR family transcriptional regulator [Microbulbifer halophilus]|uniref:MarR family transcriptional regulator n=1 Tax=Microbulbifer halophilus TaxID=453963 RepID=A0ABW5EDD6_9GAMM|nr:MarR family transcriptional regulator [Microbulbifer halophilus]MCW8127224.1 MarR family transcriptional regulator [Microbulbifer halophilus]